MVVSNKLKESGMRIHIFGASGPGTTTLGAALAEALGCSHFDSDDYFWVPSDPPYVTQREIGERRRLLGSDIEGVESWVISGSMRKWGQFTVPLFNLAVFLYVPNPVRMERLKARETRRYGAEIEDSNHPQFKAQKAFFEWAAAYDTAGLEMRSLASHEAWMKKLPCPLLRIEGEMSVEENLKCVLERIRAL
jgi:adenylate kinase family enzyme